MALPFRKQLSFAWALFRDPDVPRSAKVILPATVVYVASPIDIIPDFIPLLGQLDDLVVLTLGLALVLWLTPRHVIEDLLSDFE